jgi:hypothetical protein
MFEFNSKEAREAFMENIVKIEWDMFQKVEGLGGRADCQDQWPTFRIMRSSQYTDWPEEMLKSYYRDLEEANKAGRNLVTEKYAYMMESSSRDYFKTKLEPFLPQLDEEALSMIDEITGYLVECEKAFACQYPRLSSQGRPIEASSDTSSQTSVETYTRGELKTYSKDTLKLYRDYIRKSRSEGKNLALLVKEATVKMYGYESASDAEARM